MDYNQITTAFTDICKKTFGNNLTGVYLHGSISMNCFNPMRSDIDLLVVVNKSLTDNIKKEFMSSLIELTKKSDNGIEMSIVTKDNMSPFTYPTPYELHYSDSHKELYYRSIDEYINKLHGTDKDLAAHVTIINNYGITLFGKDKSLVFSPVKREYYIDSIYYDIENAKSDILDNPDYIILNLCRVLAYVKDGIVLSKKQGGIWGVTSVSGYSPVIKKALDNYTLNAQNTYDKEMLIEFASYMLKKIKKYI